MAKSNSRMADIENYIYITDKCNSTCVECGEQQVNKKECVLYIYSKDRPRTFNIKCLDCSKYTIIDTARENSYFAYLRS